MADTTYTAEQLAKCAEREVGQRRYVYGRRVSEGKMKPEKAKAEIEMMDIIAVRLRREADAEAAAGLLF